jgi:peptidase E
MKLILTSDFPERAPARVVAALKNAADNPRIAWIPPHTDATGGAFAAAQERFAALGFTELECLDIDEECDAVQLAYLHEFDVVFLSDGDPVRFRYNALRSGLSGRLRQCAASGRTIVGAGGGALLLTPNVSILRLAHGPAADVLATRPRLDALAAVPYELLPHANRWPPPMLDRVREYSAQIDHDIVAVADGGALFHNGSGALHSEGDIVRYRKGQIIEA